MDLLGLVGRVVISLVVVLALLWLAARGLRNNQRKSLGGVEMDVLARQPLAQRASLAVVRLGDRALVLGVTEGRIELLSEQPLADLLTPEALPAVERVALQDNASAIVSTSTAVPTDAANAVNAVVPVTRSAVRSQANGRLAGSALSPQTWSKALDAVRELTVRR